MGRPRVTTRRWVVIERKMAVVGSPGVLIQTLIQTGTGTGIGAFAMLHRDVHVKTGDGARTLRGALAGLGAQLPRRVARRGMLSSAVLFQAYRPRQFALPRRVRGTEQLKCPGVHTLV